VKGTDIDLPLCATWNKSGITVAGRQDATSSAALDALNQPMGLYAAIDGFLYVADYMNDRVMMYNTSSGRLGTPIGSDRATKSAQLHKPTSVLLDPITNVLYIVDGENGRIQRWSDGGLGTSVQTFVGPLELNTSAKSHSFRAHDIQLDPQSNTILYISDKHNGSVMKWNFRMSWSEIIAYNLSKPLGIHVDSNRDVYVADCVKSHIFKWPVGTRVAGSGERGKTLNQSLCPSAVTIDRDGTMYIAEIGNHRIMHWHPNAPSGVCLTGCSTIQGNKTDQLAAPRDLTFDWEGNLLVADTGNNRIQRFDMYIDPVCGKYRVIFHQWLSCVFK
jgi:DNA-binding beta-propeller fold protein YncE